MKTALKFTVVVLVLFLCIGYTAHATVTEQEAPSSWDNADDLLRVHVFKLDVTKTYDTITFDPVDKESAYNVFLDQILGTEENGDKVLDVCGDLTQGNGMCTVRIFIRSNGTPLIKTISFQEYR